MNKYRKQHRRISVPEMFILILTVVILMGAGVTYACLRNTQVKVVHEMDKIQKRIRDHEDSIDSLQVKIEKKLNICVLRDKLEKSGSKLTSIPVSSLEIISPYHPNEIAESRGDPTAIAQRCP